MLLSYSTYNLVSSQTPEWTKRPPETKYALAGDNVTLEWDFDKNGGKLKSARWGPQKDGVFQKILVAWNQNKTPELRSPSKALFEMNGTLTLLNVDINDTAMYMCDLSFESVTLTSTTHLIVVGKSELSILAGLSELQ